MDELVERLKPIPISYFLVGAIALGGLYYWMYFDAGQAIQTRIQTQSTELDSVKKSLSDTEAVIGDKEKFETEYNTVSDQFRAAIEYLPSSFNIQSLLKQIYNEARSAGIELEKTVPRAGSAPGMPSAAAVAAAAAAGNTQGAPTKFYEELLIDVTLTGSYPQLTLFLSYMSRLQRIVNIRDVEIKFDKMADNTPFLTMKGTLVSYRYLEGR